MSLETEYSLDKTNFNSIKTGEVSRIFFYNPKNHYFKDILMTKNDKNECFVKIQTGIIQEKGEYLIPRIDRHITTKIC